MLRKLKALLVPALAGGVLVSCGGDSGSGPDPAPEEAAFPADFASTYMLVAGDRVGNPPHVACIRVYCSPSEAGTYSGAGTMPEGTVLVKEIYSNSAGPGGACSSLTGYAVMRKGAPGSAPSSGDWTWQEADANRNVTDSGQIASCIACHSQPGNVDYTLIDPVTRL